MKRIIVLFGVLMFLMVPAMGLADAAGLEFQATWDNWEYFQVGSATLPADTQSLPVGEFGAAFITGIPSTVVSQGAVVEGIMIFDTTNTIGPIVQIKLPNFINENPLKKVWVESRFLGNRDFGTVTSVPPDSFVEVSPKVRDGETNYFFQAAYIEIRPNPSFETINLALGGDCGFEVDWLHVRTECVPAPIPGSLLLLGSGIIGLVGIGMRRKSS